MASEVDICNLALAHIAMGANRTTGLVVQSIDPPDGSVEAQYCSIFYPVARDTLLGNGYAWSFAVARSSLAQLVNDNPSQWIYAYQLPNLCLVPMKVLAPGATADTKNEPFTVGLNSSGVRALYTNVQDAQLVYIRAVTDTTTFTPMFVLALSWQLAHLLAGPLTKKASIVEATLKMAQHYVSEAMRVDAKAHFDEVHDSEKPSHLKARMY